MSEIGLGQHYNWFNGSGSCWTIRRGAAEKLPEALRSHGYKPSPELMRLAKDVANRGEREYDDRYVLTRTWQCISDIIQAHIQREGDSNWNERVQRLRDHYGPRDDAWMMAPYGSYRGVR